MQSPRRARTLEYCSSQFEVVNVVLQTEIMGIVVVEGGDGLGEDGQLDWSASPPLSPLFHSQEFDLSGCPPIMTDLGELDKQPRSAILALNRPMVGG